MCRYPQETGFRSGCHFRFSGDEAGRQTVGDLLLSGISASAANGWRIVPGLPWAATGGCQQHVNGTTTT